jgi:REP element-mobilizing transposase RayT
MATARGQVFNPAVLGYYHCTVRCVRRSYLCGYDKILKRDFEHRRAWIRDRLTLLLEVFSIDCFAYAVMSNHLHMVIRNNPQIAATWSPRDIATRWRKLFPKHKEKEAIEQDIERIAEDTELVEKYRQRLCCISWFNRCMNENIARRANREDDCKGRFWEGRFSAQKLTSMSAVIACGVYVDLNPVRAKIATKPEDSNYTSIQDRIRANAKRDKASRALQKPRLIAVSEIAEFSEAEYINLVDLVGRNMHRDKKGRIDPSMAPIFQRLKIPPERLIENSHHQSRLFSRVIGTVQDMRAFAAILSQKWVHGLRSAEMLFA